MKHALLKRTEARGAALIMALSLISLMTILLVGFLASMQIDRAASRSHMDGQQAQWYAQVGVDLSIAKLKSLSSSTAVWASMPGRITVVGTGGNPSTNIDLSSGSARGETDSKVVVNLNPRTLLFSSKGLIAKSGENISVRWIYLRRDGSFEANTPPTYNQANPVVGRFAFWADDASTRVNINTAASRIGNTNALSHPSRVDMTAFLGTPAIESIQVARNVRPFNSLFEARRIVNTDAFNTNQFALTHFNHSPLPSVNMFGEPRILLTTQKGVAEKIYGTGTTNYLDILTVPDTDPGSPSNLDSVKVEKIVNRIANYLRRTDWPILPGKSFASKYTPFTTSPTYNNNYVAQIAINILDYVRCAESTLSAVAATKGRLDPVSGNFVYGTTGLAVNPGASGVSPAPWWNSNFPSTMMGLSRGPRITEFRCTITSTNPWADGSKWDWTAKYEVEVTLPENSGLSSIDLSTLTISAESMDPTGMVQGWSNRKTIPITGAMCSGGGSTLAAGNYKTITVTGILPTNQKTPTPTTVYAMASLEPTIDTTAVISGFGNNTAPIYWQTFTLVAGNTVNSCARKYTDVMLPSYPEAWTTQGPSSFDATNPGAITSVSATPSQDKDGSGNVTSVSTRLPAPKGSASNLLGIVKSVGELGFIHTGSVVAHMHSTSTSGILYGTIVPYRTLRLRPQDATSGELPDWAILDLFDAPGLPQSSTSTVLRPGNASVGGQINVNGGLVTFIDQNGNPTLTRSLPMQCALTGAGNKTATVSSVIPSTSVSTLANAINSYAFTNDSLATNGKRYGTGVLTNVFISPWQICEIKGVADSGEESEEVVRHVGSVGTVRGNVFSIYSIGQSIKQDSNGGVSILGERRMETIVERYQDTPNSSATFRTIFSRDLKSL